MSKYIVVAKECICSGGTLLDMEYSQFDEEGNLTDDQWFDFEGEFVLGIYEAESGLQARTLAAEKYRQKVTDVKAYELK